MLHDLLMDMPDFIGNRVDYLIVYLSPLDSSSPTVAMAYSRILTRQGDKYLNDEWDEYHMNIREISDFYWLAVHYAEKAGNQDFIEEIKAKRGIWHGYDPAKSENPLVQEIVAEQNYEKKLESFLKVNDERIAAIVAEGDEFFKNQQWGDAGIIYRKAADIAEYQLHDPKKAEELRNRINVKTEELKKDSPELFSS